MNKITTFSKLDNRYQLSVLRSLLGFTSEKITEVINVLSAVDPIVRVYRNGQVVIKSDQQEIFNSLLKL